MIFLSLMIFTGYILFFPKAAVEAASNGLVLWYTRVLPTLLPFAILSNILIYSNYLQYINRLFAPLLKKLFSVSENGAFVLLTGFLFGFPMGSKNCAELLKCGRLKKKEADVLFIITNNISPVFIAGYILCGQLAMPKLTVISLLIVYLPPLLLGEYLLTRKETADTGNGNISHHNKGSEKTVSDRSCLTEKMPASGSQMNFKIIDAGIMNGFETLTRLGGYIMLFSMIASIIQKLPFPSPAGFILTGMTELTNGISMLSSSGLTPAMQYILAMIFTAFGGLSGIAQTSSMIKDTGLSLKNYCLTKLLLTILSGILAGCVTIFFHI